MGLFGGTAAKCVYCGRKAGAFSSMTLGGDQSCLCAECADAIPEYMKDQAKEWWDSDNYTFLRKGMERSAAELAPAFKETFSYHKLHVDEEKGLFYFSEGFSGKLGKKTLVWDMRNLIDVEFNFRPVSVNNGLFSSSVTGEIHMVFKMALPAFVRDIVLTSDVKGKATSNTLGTKVDYMDPEELSALTERFIGTAQNFMEILKLNEIWEQHKQEVAAARNMFMLRPDEEIDAAKLDRQYERLTKGFADDEEALEHLKRNYELLLKEMKASEGNGAEQG